MWAITNPNKTNGKRKWRVNSRSKVGCLTENPPHTQITKSLPTIGIALKRLVITVAPQKDIWPQGRTYPIKAAAIIRRRIEIPENQTYFCVKQPNHKPRQIWT